MRGQLYPSIHPSIFLSSVNVFSWSRLGWIQILSQEHWLQGEGHTWKGHIGAIKHNQYIYRSVFGPLEETHADTAWACEAEHGQWDRNMTAVMQSSCLIVCLQLFLFLTQSFFFWRKWKYQHCFPELITWCAVGLAVFMWRKQTFLVGIFT